MIRIITGLKNKIHCVIEYTIFFFQNVFFMYIIRDFEYGVLLITLEKRAGHLYIIHSFLLQLRKFMRSNYKYIHI